MNETILHQASFSGFIRTILIIIAVYYILKIAMRLLAPYLMRKVVQKAEQKFQQNFEQQFRQQQDYSKENYTQNTTSKNQNPKPTKKVGEYIDYEEVE